MTSPKFRVGLLLKSKNPKYLEIAFRLAPLLETPQRATKALNDQFIYRFNASTDFGVIYAVVQFGHQLVFQIMAVSQPTADRLANDMASSGETISTRDVFRCVLKRPLLCKK
jgi:hypothetical protein